ncbi:zinc finger CCHC domain-containing protein 10 isoform X1 [Drosophila biarmipes]|uniref:zinc finger CCHC domain-containing protein 10 isoform X1 n=2 Tax=Drosophila biarmipes TaxID=125945 RepID=UPI0007E6DBB0|nr:zinc finger CCHC domain-containing protein 10 isoform X1 [Drosophila biarmipes]
MGCGRWSITNVTKKLYKKTFLILIFPSFSTRPRCFSTHIKISSQHRLLECFRMTLVGLAARKLAQKKRSAKLAADFPNGIRCQKCLQIGHWSYECKEKRKFVHRSSRTKQLSKHLAQKEAEAPKNEVEEQLEVASAGGKKVRRKRKTSKSSSSSSSSSDSSDSSSESESSSGSDSSSSSSDSDDEEGSSSGSSGSSSSSDSDSSEDEKKGAPQKKKKRAESSAESSDEQE